jgi:hypothetical protein
MAVAMRVLRTIAGVLVWLVATVLLIVALVLCLSVLLLPVGLLVGRVALRLYRVGIRLLLPRPRDLSRGIRKEGRRWRRKIPLPAPSRKRSGRLATAARKLGR